MQMSFKNTDDDIAQNNKALLKVGFKYFMNSMSLLIIYYKSILPSSLALIENILSL